MSDAALAPAKKAARRKKPAKPRKPARSAERHKYNAMIATAITSLKQRGGSSRQAILKYIIANYKVGVQVNKINARLRTVLKAGVKAGTLKQVKGSGAFRKTLYTMSDATPAPTKMAARRKKRAKPRISAKSAELHKYNMMIADAITSLKQRSGPSRQAILKYIMANYKVGVQVNKINARLRTVLKAGVKAGTLKQVKGSGAIRKTLYTVSDATSAPTKMAARRKKPAKPRKPARSAERHKYNAMIATAITSLKQRGGSSRQAILKYIIANYKVGVQVNKINARLRNALKAGVKAGTLKQVKGTGAIRKTLYTIYNVKPASAKMAARRKKLANPRKPAKSAEHPKYNVMIAAAITSLKERGGSSRQAILKYIMANYKVGVKVTYINARLKTALKAGVKAGTLKQVKGSGASGSFRLGEKKVAAAKPKKRAAKKAKSPVMKAAAKKSKFSAKKAAKPAKKAVKSPAARAAKPKTPKKAAAKELAKKVTRSFSG